MGGWDAVKIVVKGQGAIWLGILVVVCVCVNQNGAAAEVPSNDKNAPTLAEIVERLAQAQSENHLAARPYTVLRDYELVNGKKPESSSQVQAEISYSPPNTKEYAIRAISGGGMGERVVRRVLEHETAMASSWKESALSEENYSFELLGKETVEGHDCYVLKLTPSRDSKDLVHGRAWIDAEEFNVRRVEGTVKTPSWWLKRVEITMRFSQVMGMWLQTAFVAKAEVRFFGEHTLTAQDVQFRANEVAGETQSWQPNGVAGSPAMVGAGILSMPWRELR